MAGDGGISVRVEFPPEVEQRIRAGITPEDGAKVVDVIDGAIIDTDYFRSGWQAGQLEWEALDPKYVRWKARRGYSTSIWTMTGATFRALTKRVRVGVGGGSIRGRVVRMLANAGGHIRASWKIVAPASGGSWGPTHFSRNNERRPWLKDIPEGSWQHTLIAKRVKSAAVRIARRILKGDAA